MPAVRRITVALAFTAVVASTLAVEAPAPVRGAEHEVQITDSTFSPATLTIPSATP